MASTARMREVAWVTPRSAERRLHFPECFVHRLCVEEILRGHMGCVNRLAWNTEGTLLASGSDDRRIMLWRYPDAKQPPICVETMHQANIFGVAFLPCTGDQSLISGAMDFSVQLHRLDHSPTTSRTPRQRPLDPSATVQQTAEEAVRRPLMANCGTTVFNCHKGRVKMVAVEPANPHLFWSASEDGTVRQFDTRCGDQSDYESSNVLLAVKQKARSLDLLALSINKVQPQLLAIASSDPFVRIYDRRKLTLGSPESVGIVAKPMLKMAPPHMCLVNARHAAKPNATHVSFGNRGDRLVASYHTDHAYSFDISGSADSTPIAFTCGQSSEACASGSATAMLSIAAAFMPRSAAKPLAPPVAAGPVLPDAAEAAKNDGNRAYFDHDENAAVWHYTRAIHIAPNSALLHASRASAYLKREWLADGWAAIQDCETAIRLEPGFAKGHRCRVQALIALGQFQAAKAAVQQFAADFPVHADDAARLRESVEAELEKQRLKAQRSASRRRAADDRRQQAALERSQSDPQHVPGPEAAAGAEGGTDPSPMDEGSDDGDDSSDSEDGNSQGPAREGWERDEEMSSSSREGEPLAYGDPSIAGQVHRMLQRFVGHCNVQTDIKEACFLGGDDGLVAAGSDDGHVFVYNAVSGCLVRRMRLDDSAVLLPFCSKGASGRL